MLDETTKDNNVPDPPVEQNSDKGEGVASPPLHARVFTAEELDALERGIPIVASEEKEEYDKEIEERLHPLDEIELKKKRAMNAARTKEPTLAELSEELGLPVETLQRTRESSPGAVSSPEYWTEWFKDTRRVRGRQAR